MKTMIELFSGSCNMAKTFRKAGYKTLTLDIEENYNPDIVADILSFEVFDLPEEFRSPTVVWASPPCTVFSVASMYRYWEDSTKPKSWKTYIGLAILKKTLEIIEELNPEYYFIENPRGMMRKQFFMKRLPRKTVAYCQYGADYMKPTDIWTNASSWIPRPMCSNGDDCHEESKRGSDSGLQAQHRSPFMRSIIPTELCEEIVDVCSGNVKTKQEVLV